MKQTPPSILRAPQLSTETRKLGTRKRNQAVAESVAATVAANAETRPELPATIDVDALVDKARSAVLAQVRAEADEAKELARQQGLLEGREAGLQEAKQAFTTDIARIRGVADRLGGTLRSQIAGLEDMAAAIAFEAVCKLLGDGAGSSEQIQALVRAAAAHASERTNLVVRLNEADLAVLKKTGALDDTLPNSKVKWQADTDVELGGCVVSTDFGDIDARLEIQIERLRDAIMAAQRK